MMLTIFYTLVILSVAKININKCKQGTETLLCLEFVLHPLPIGVYRYYVSFYILNKLYYLIKVYGVEKRSILLLSGVFLNVSHS